jgi:hypothetical protein
VGTIFFVLIEYASLKHLAKRHLPSLHGCNIVGLRSRVQTLGPAAVTKLCSSAGIDCGIFGLKKQHFNPAINTLNLQDVSRGILNTSKMNQIHLIWWISQLKPGGCD